MKFSSSVKKFAIVMLVIAALNFVIGAGINSVRPVVTNKVALTQLNDSDDSYVTWNLYNKAWVIWEWSWAVFIAVSVIGSVKLISNSNNDSDDNSNNNNNK